MAVPALVMAVIVTVMRMIVKCMILAATGGTSILVARVLGGRLSRRRLHRTCHPIRLNVSRCQMSRRDRTRRRGTGRRHLGEREGGSN